MVKKIFFPIMYLFLNASISEAIQPDLNAEGLNKQSISTANVNSTHLTLKNCFQLALNQSESLKNLQEQILQSNARARSALGGAFPQLNWSLTDTIQDADTSGGGGGVGGTLTRKERIEHRFTLEQTWFSGARELSATKGFKRESARDQYRWKRKGVDLFLEVAHAFYGVFLAETNLKNTQAALKLSQDRLAELKHRFQIGKTRESELLSAESQLALLKADEISQRAQVALKRNDLSFLIGIDVGALSLEETDFKMDSGATLDLLLERVESRTDILAQKEDVEAKRFQVRYERGGYLPSLDLRANYYTRRVGFQDGIDWDALFTFDVPIYQGGSASANVKRALSEWRQAENNFVFLKRQVISLVRQGYINWSFASDQTRQLQEAYSKAQRSYDLQVKEYRLGLVNNLEVLSALNEALQDKQRLDRALIEQKLYFLELKTTVEDLSFL